MKGLYAIVDVTLLSGRGLPVVETARTIARCRPAALQLRAKDIGARETLSLLRAIVPLCRENGVLSFANDRPDLAALSGCDGIHVGQTDLPIDAVRRIAPNLRVGVSTHDSRQLAEAVVAKPDYVAFGPVFATKSKANPDPVVGLSGLADAARRSTAPLLAIGGIDVERVPEVIRLVASFAVIGGLVPSTATSNDLSPIRERVELFQRAIAGAVAPPGLEPGRPSRDGGF